MSVSNKKKKECKCPSKMA